MVKAVGTEAVQDEGDGRSLLDEIAGEGGASDAVGPLQAHRTVSALPWTQAIFSLMQPTSVAAYHAPTPAEARAETPGAAPRSRWTAAEPGADDPTPPG